MSPQDGSSVFLPFHEDERVAQALAGQGAGQVVGQGADILRNRHVIVVEHDQKIRGQRAGVI